MHTSKSCICSMLSCYIQGHVQIMLHSAGTVQVACQYRSCPAQGAQPHVTRVTALQEGDLWRPICPAQVLREHRETLVSVMETFVHDPLCEWTKRAVGTAGEEGDNPQAKDALATLEGVSCSGSAQGAWARTAVLWGAATIGLAEPQHTRRRHPACMHSLHAYSTGIQQVAGHRLQYARLLCM